MLLVEVGERIEKVAEKAKVESSGNVYRIRRYLWRNDHGETTLQSLESEWRLASGHGAESDRMLEIMRRDRIASAKPGSFFQKHSRSG